MKKLNIKKMGAFLNQIVEHKIKSSLMIWGAPGIGKSSVVELQCGDNRHTPSLFFDQCLHRYSVRYLPDSILAWMVAMETLLDEHPAVLQMG